MYAMPMIKMSRRMRRTRIVAKQAPVTLNGTARADLAPAIVKCHGDKLSEAFK